MKARLFPLLLAVAAWGQAPAPPPAAWTPEISMRVQPVGESADVPRWQAGRVHAEPCGDGAEKSEVDTQTRGRGGWLASRSSTRGKKSATAPEFSPDSRYIYFSSERSGKPNLWRIPVDGGEADAHPLEGEMGAFHVSPGGKWVAFAGMEPRADEELAKKEKRDFRVIDENPKNHSLWIVAVEPDSQGKRTPRHLDTPGHATDFDWSPDSHFIAFSHTPTPKADDWTQADISEVNVETGAVRAVAATGASERSPRYSPDGRYLAYLRSTDPARWAGIDRIVLLTRQSGESRELPPTFDEQPRLLGWAGDSARMVFAKTRGTANVIYAMPVDGEPKPLSQPLRGTLQPGSLNATGTLELYRGELRTGAGSLRRESGRHGCGASQQR